ncbi:DUF5071 domain-containing protein [Paenibacillus rigui]|uniref:DUF5071 domain-containing protein n=1 Tax=Paenibacillus rigui TaxID=554312 RepID=A0A229UFZ3_9BACL|nr:DUF5071 domain-containing protein [Paenibacillus rigui]OXM82304.1 DUF5071 domain-containing protein [Paenibacillus rigui]
MDIKILIPKHKFDFESVEKLKKLNLEEIKPILPELLEWLQDMNWPIAQEIETLLLSFQEQLIPYIKNVLNTNDGTWKYFLLHGLINKLPKHVLKDLKTDLERMKNSPTDDEKYEELEDILEELLEKI